MKNKCIMILDVETMGIEDKTVFEVGVLVHDLETGKNLELRSFLVKEVWDFGIVKKAYYYERNKSFYESQAKHIEMKHWYEIKKELSDFTKKYEIENILAYNIGFDLQALIDTDLTIWGNGELDFLPQKHGDVLTIAYNYIASTDEYRAFCQENNLITRSAKYYSCSAENVYKYITQNINFVESHIGVEDIMIELDILKYCLKLQSDEILTQYEKQIPFKMKI